MESYKYRTDWHSAPSILDKADVVHFRFGINDKDTARGLSPLRSVDRELYVDRAASEYTAEIMVNGMNTTLVTPERGPDGYSMADPRCYRPDTATAAPRRARHPARRGLRDGRAAEAGETRLFAAEMDTRNTRKMPEERLSSRLTLPAVVLGFGAGLDRSTFANFSGS